MEEVRLGCDTPPSPLSKIWSVKSSGRWGLIEGTNIIIFNEKGALNRGFAYHDFQSKGGS